jgi:hypothetical protein
LDLCAADKRGLDERGPDRCDPDKRGPDERAWGPWVPEAHV